MNGTTQRYLRSLNRLGKWRTHFAGWQLGTRTAEDPEAQAVRDHREATMILRAEVTALTALAADKGLFTITEFEEQVAVEADALSDAYSRRFPGVRASDEGLVYDARATEWLQNWRP